MGVGFRVRSTNGNVLQIDNTFKNLGLIAKGSINTVANDSYFPQTVYAAQITVTGNNPQVALIPPIATAVYRREQNGNSFTFTVFSSQPATIPYYVFDYSAQGVRTAKLKMKDANGAVFFDSSIGYLKIVGMVSTNGTFNTPADRTCAVLMNVGGYEYHTSGFPSGFGPPYYNVTESQRISGCTMDNSTNQATSGIMSLVLYLKQNQYYPSPSEPPTITYGTTGATFPVIDVTHY